MTLLTFLGAAGEVTGSCYLFETGRTRFLVDCGMFQGGSQAYRKNLSAFGGSCAPASLDFVVLTHAHLDHSGLLPRLVALGFKGPVYATAATCDLLEVMLLDSAHIQEKEAEWENRHQHTRHARRGWERAPLYTVAQATASLRQLRRCEYARAGGQPLQPAPDVSLAFHDAGHILGSSIVELKVGAGDTAKTCVISGDLGQPGRSSLNDPTRIAAADVLLVESTYGNRLHKSLERTENELVAVIGDTLERKRGNVIMPAFSVGRTQEVLFVLTDLVRRGRLPALDIYVDSPMALAATELTLKHHPLLDAAAHELIEWQRRHPRAPRIRFVEDVEESMALNGIRGGAVILAASGMCEAGRIKHHLRHNLPRHECSVVITGFQAVGTLGRRLVDGARRVKIFGEEVPVRADVYTIGGLSAHADRAALLGWLGGFARPPGKVFVVHGERETALDFALATNSLPGWESANVAVPQLFRQTEF